MRRTAIILMMVSIVYNGVRNDMVQNIVVYEMFLCVGRPHTIKRAVIQKIVSIKSHSTIGLKIKAAIACTHSPRSGADPNEHGVCFIST